MKYLVLIEQPLRRTAIVAVEAESESEARKMARERSGNPAVWDDMKAGRVRTKWVTVDIDPDVA